MSAAFSHDDLAVWRGLVVKAERLAARSNASSKGLDRAARAAKRTTMPPAWQGAREDNPFRGLVEAALAYCRMTLAERSGPAADGLSGLAQAVSLQLNAHAAPIPRRRADVDGPFDDEDDGSERGVCSTHSHPVPSGPPSPQGGGTRELSGPPFPQGGGTGR